MEEALRTSEERFRTLVENANDGIYIRDETGTIIYANKRFADIHGRPLDEIVGLKAADLLHDEDRELLGQKGVWEQLQAGMSVKDKSRIVRPSGEIRHTDMSAVPIRQDGEAVRVFGIVRDITEIEKTAQLRTQFFSNVSHELRTPLTSIVGYSDLILRGGAGDISEEQEKLLRIVMNNAAKLTHLVNDVLDVERIESREMPFEVEAVRLDDVLEEAVQSLRAEADSKGIIMREIAPTGLVVAADPDHLSHLFGNLISNAVKYTLSGTVEVRAEESGGMALIEVKDTGIGMAEGEVSQLFRRFFRADNNHVRKVAGTGLGLAIAKAIVDRHNGTIRVDSTPDEGTTFRVSLPLATEDAPRLEQGM